MHLRPLLSITVLAVCAIAVHAERYIDTMPPQSTVAAGFSRPEVEARLAELPAVEVEGLWQMTADGAIVAIERWQPDHLPAGGTLCLRMVVVSAPNRSLRPGTLMGYIAPTAAPGVYDASIYTSLDENGTLSGAKSFRLRATDNALTLTRVRGGLIVDWLRMFPYLLRRAFHYAPDDRNGIDGLVRLRDPLPRYF
ncbi:MAG: hypothetical protein NC187_06080 [Candidatus Amulumruptor caecigallinarius]|nr:hypothetical protein [Candidatus Amulumruptor caecigallinarius]MCM1397038.1 hypothetical protein [Candidatus Amulumruptor caecigallinarius]MCM1454026.1 hypothetical protein [bacterium]